MQASPAELNDGLASVHAFEVDGHWRQLSDEYAAKVFTDVLNNAVAEDMPLGQMSVSKITASLVDQDVPEFVVKCLLQRFGSAVDAEGEGEVLYKLNEASVCKHEAIELFKIQEVRKANTCCLRVHAWAVSHAWRMYFVLNTRARAVLVISLHCCCILCPDRAKGVLVYDELHVVHIYRVCACAYFSLSLSLSLSLCVCVPVYVVWFAAVAVRPLYGDVEGTCA